MVVQDAAIESVRDTRKRPNSSQATMYPYCLWIKTLRLSDLAHMLEDLRREQYRDIRTWFFSPPLERLYAAVNVPTQGDIVLFNTICVEAAEKIARFLQAVAVREDRTVGLTSLEARTIPSDKLCGLVSRLPLLTSLSVSKGYVLTPPVSTAIRQSCPLFKELVCYDCIGTDVDTDMAGCLDGLGPNTLESFSTMSRNNFGSHTYAALARHAVSLKKLRLFVDHGSQALSITGLPVLGNCKNLRTLHLEASIGEYPPEIERFRPEVFFKIRSWLRQCTSLTDLCFDKFPGTLSVLDEVLAVPEIKLVSLTVKLDEGFTEPLWVALQGQTDLESLVLTSTDPRIIWEDRYELLHETLITFTKMRKLHITHEFFTLQDVHAMAKAMPYLEDFSFEGVTQFVEDEYLDEFASMRHLKVLTINACSGITHMGLVKFIKALDPQTQDGFRMDLLRQMPNMDDNSQAQLNRQLKKRVRGWIEIAYEPENNGYSDEDFSD